MIRIIYFDNAATSRNKPKCVLDAYMEYITEIGVSPGRGSYSLAIQASRMLYQSRKTVAKFFGLLNNNVVFTKNSTEAINLFFNGFLRKGDSVLISPYEHNAVLRPLNTLKEKGIIEYDVLPEATLYEPEIINRYITPKTKLVAITLASNLTGEIIYNHKIGEICRNKGIVVFVDASQGGGKKLVDMSSDCIDYLAFTGHKDLLGLPGVGGLCSVKKLDFPPLIQGGTGIHGENYSNPDIYPDAYESGTLNMPSIWALKVALEYIESNIADISKKEKELMEYLEIELSKSRNVILYKPGVRRVPTICFNIKGYSSSDVVAILNTNNICARGGIHCAILAHEQLGTVETGAVRLSLNYTNTVDQINHLLYVIRSIGV